MKPKPKNFAEIKTGTDLRKFRKSLGLTQVELGEKLGVAGHYIYMIESGKRTGLKMLNMRLKLIALEKRELSAQT